MPPHVLPEILGEYAHRKAARFHMPGHKGRGMNGFFQAGLMGWDITELSFSDDLHDPSASILVAQQACAERYGAAHTFFLVNGSTAGLHALMHALPKGSRILLGRDCHRAALNGAALCGHTIAYVHPAFLQEEGLWGCVTPEALEETLQKSPADGVCITSPNYYGFCADIPALARVAHAAGALLFVDAAHGAHFPFAKALPESPAGYADAWVNSAHKTLNALGQAALLHIGLQLDAARVQRALSLLQTSSPSYLLLASLDWARYTAGLQDAWENAVARCNRVRRLVARIPGLYALSASIKGPGGVADTDASKLVIDVSGRGLSGYAAAKALEKEDVFVEMADSRRLLLICTPADDPHWYPQLLKALERLPYAPGDRHFAPVEYPIPAPAISSAEAIFLPTTLCPLKEAAGHIAADCVGVYPPGIPLWASGERITDACISHLRAMEDLGASFFGMRQGAVSVVLEQR